MRKERYVRFYDLDPEIKRLYHIHIADNTVRPQLWRENIDDRIDYSVRAYESAMSRLDWLDDDFIPYVSCITGTEIFAEAFGCEVKKPDNSNPYALPMITESAEVSRIKIPNLEDSTLCYLFEMADKIKAKCGGDTLLSLPDVQTPMDIAALIWDKNYFYIALIEEPEAVKELAYKISVLYFAFFDEWFRRYGKEFIAHFPDYYMPYGLTYSEDEIGAVSSDVYDELFLPELIEISERYGSVGMHSCANSRHQWDGFMKIPNLKLLNLVQPYDTIVKSSGYFAGTTAMFPSWGGFGLPETWFSQLNENAHVLLDFHAGNDEEAKRLADKLRSNA